MFIIYNGERGELDTCEVLEGALTILEGLLDDEVDGDELRVFEGIERTLHFHRRVTIE